MIPDVSILADSVNSGTGDRLTTFLLGNFPKSYLAELNTHRSFSRNAASSRAMPIAKVIEQVQKNPFIPQWTAHAKGMVGTDTLSDNDRRLATVDSLHMRNEAVKYVQRLADRGVAKQDVNRYLEPWMIVPVVFSATEWDNFFILRTAPDVQPDFRAFACEMQSLMNKSEPKRLSLGEWHIPIDTANLPLKDRIKASVAACARGSYGSFISDKPDLAKDIALHDRLMVSGHWSPFEHQACCAKSGRYANYRGWESYRFACEL